MREIVYEQPTQGFVKERMVKTAEATTESIYCSCILTVRALGANLPKGDAKDLKRNSTPSVGGVVILKYGSVYHVAYISHLFPGAMYIKEGNFPEPCEYNERTLLFTDEHIIGFFHTPDVDVGDLIEI